jgi:uncharacterized protein YndB with AHSA1/START domain
MAWLLFGIGLVVVLIGVAYFIGARLPRDHVASVRTRFTAPPEMIWPVISNVVDAPSWRDDIKAVELLPGNEGKLAWREDSRNGKISYEMAELDPPRRMVTRITTASLPFGGEWETTLTPRTGGSELLTVERGFVRPPLFRFMARYVFGLASTLNAYHRALGRRLGESVHPEIIMPGR